MLIKNHLCTIFREGEGLFEEELAMMGGKNVLEMVYSCANLFSLITICFLLLLVDCSLVELSLDKRTHCFSTFPKVLPWLKPKAIGPCKDDKFARIVARAFEIETTTKDIRSAEIGSFIVVNKHSIII